MQTNVKLTLLFLSLSAPVLAQHELGLSFMHHVWQSNITNPAIVQDKTVVIGLMGIRNNIAFDGPTYNEIVSHENGKAVIDIDRFIDKLDSRNKIRDDLDIPTLSAALRLGKLTLSLGHSVKYHAFFEYPKTLPQLVWQGNAQFIGQEVDLGNELQLTGYHELAAGAAYKFGVLTLGAKAKFLSGIADATTDDDHHTASLFTDPDVYQITLNGDYILHTANSFNYNSYKDLSADFNYGNLTLERFFSKNAGFAFDLGVRLEIGKLDLSASLLDLGKITWDDDVTNYIATKSYEYDGLDFSEALTGGEDVNFDQALDTLDALFQVEKTSSSYSSKLPRKIYLSGVYKLNETWSLGGLFFNENFRGKSTVSAAVGANAALFKFLNAGATYAVKDGTFDNIGLNVTLTLGPVQVFAVTDNVIAAFKPGDTNNYSVRLGAGLCF